MSKIVEALEKARKDGALDPLVGAVDERVSLAPVGSAEAGRVGASRGEKRRRGPSAQAPGALCVEASVLKGVDAHLEAVHKPMSVVAEQYRSLRSRIERLNASGAMHALAITSAAKGEGKSLTACNLAATLAQDASKRILLVDTDLRRPGVPKLLGLPLSPGLAEYLTGQVHWAGVLRETGLFGLTVITPGESGSHHPSELLASPAFAELVERARAEYDYVLFDCPPLHPISDVSFLVEAMDGVILVVRAKKTAKGFIKDITAGLPPGKLVGAVLNRADSVSHGYGYRRGYYSYYGNR